MLLMPHGPQALDFCSYRYSVELTLMSGPDMPARTIIGATCDSSIGGFAEIGWGGDFLLFKLEFVGAAAHPAPAMAFSPKDAILEIFAFSSDGDRS